jgi:hypothetical protein
LTTRRVLFIVLGSLSVVFIAFVATSPFPALTLRLVVEEFFPSMISWEGKTAWKRCDSAIGGTTSWPESAQAACEAMHLCANEAPLSEAQTRRLSELIRGTPGCPEP